MLAVLVVLLTISLNLIRQEKKMKDVMKRFFKDERGLETVEYAIIAGLITVATIATITLISAQVNTKFNDLLTALGGGS